jgi:hypothetical protein
VESIFIFYPLPAVLGKYPKYQGGKWERKCHGFVPSVSSFSGDSGKQIEMNCSLVPFLLILREGCGWFSLHSTLHREKILLRLREEYRKTTPKAVSWEACL